MANLAEFALFRGEKTINEIESKSVIRPTLTVYYALIGLFSIPSGILTASLSLRSPLHLRQRCDQSTQKTNTNLP